MPLLWNGLTGKKSHNYLSCRKEVVVMNMSTHSKMLFKRLSKIVSLYLMNQLRIIMGKS